MDSYQAKIGWKRMRKSENKNYRSVPFLPDAKQKFRKEQQKNSENQKIPLWLHFNPKQVGIGQEKQKIKIIVPFRSYPALNRKLKKIAKKFKKLKNTITGSFLAKIGRKRPRKTQNKNYRSVSFLTGTKQKIQKKKQKNSKN